MYFCFQDAEADTQWDSKKGKKGKYELLYEADYHDPFLSSS